MIGWYQLVNEWQIEVQIHYPYLTRTRPRNWKLLSKQLLARQWAVQNFTIQIILLMFQNPCTTWDVFQTPCKLMGVQLPPTGEFFLGFPGCHQQISPEAKAGPQFGKVPFSTSTRSPGRRRRSWTCPCATFAALTSGKPRNGIGCQNLIILLGTISREYVYTYMYIYIHIFGTQHGSSKFDFFEKS